MGAPVVTIQKNGQVLKSLTLDSSEAILGRAEGCVIRLEDRAVSRHHAVLRSGPGGLRIEKKSHLAPLVVNGAECDAATLKEGDEIRIGPYVLRIGVPADSVPSPGDASPAQPAPALESGGVAVTDPLQEGAPAPDAGGLVLDGSLDAGVGADGEVRMEGGELAPPGELPSGDAAIPGIGQDPSGEAGGGALDPAPELSSMIEEDARTRMLPQGALVRLKLKFAPGAASVETAEFDQDEVSLGRGKGCDVVLNDKKASRKHLVIRRSGQGVETVFTIRDLESANGIFVNGAKVTEHVLSGDDVVRVGDTEFIVQAVLPNYDKQAAGFLQVADAAPLHEAQDVVQGMAQLPDDGFAQANSPAVAEPSPMQPVPGGDGFAPMAGIPGISGIPGSAPAGRMSLLDRYRALPPRSRMIWLAFIGVGIWALVDEIPGEKPRPAEKKPAIEQQVGEKKAPAQGGEGALPAFEQLTPELQKFVASQYDLALEYFRNRDYDRSLFEVRKIFQYVADYKDARDLERYSVESKQRLQAQEDERRRREAEEANKARVARLVVEVEGHMARKEYVQARELFGEIVAIDPDNAQVPGWRKEIAEYEEARERERQLRQYQRETNSRVRGIIASGNQALKQGRWLRAVEVYQSALALDPTDKKLVAEARSGIARARAGLVAVRDPLIEEGRRLEQESAYPEAFKKFAAAKKVDPASVEARNGMDRVRGFLRDRSKQLYTEAVLAESYSDFSLAKTRFEQLLQIAPSDDPYYERARRKLSRYVTKEELPR